MRAFILASILCTLIATSVEAQLNAAGFLKIRSSARQAGMGDVSTAVAGDITCIETNPASLVAIEHQSVQLAHADWLGQLRSEYVAYGVHFLPGLSAGLALDFFSMDETIRRNAAGDADGTFGAGYGIYTLGLGWYFSDEFSGGVSLKNIYEKIDDHESSAYACDLGVLYSDEGTNVGASIQNAGSSLKLDNDEFPLPLLVNAGVWRHFSDQARAGLDISDEAGQPVSVKLGGEYEFLLSDRYYGSDYSIILRAGYVYSGATHAAAGYTAGLGYRREEVSFNYAFVPYGELGLTHRVSLQFDFR